MSRGKGRRSSHPSREHQRRAYDRRGSRRLRWVSMGPPAWQTGTGGPQALVQSALDDPPSPDAIRQLEDAFGRPPHQPGQSDRIEFDYDDVVEQSFPASDPPPPPG